MMYKTSKELKQEKVKKIEEFVFKCRCGIIEKEKSRVYTTSKGEVCVKCYLNMI